MVPESPEAIEGYLALRGPSAYTRHAHFRVLRSFFRWLHERYGLADPMRLLKAPVLRPKPMRTLSLAELTRLLEATEGSVRDRVLVMLLVDTGLRIGEAHSLTAQALGDGVITVRGKTGERIVPVSTLVLDLLREVLPWAGAKGRLTLSGLQQVVRRAMARAGITGARASPHTLRHSFAKQYLMAGGDVFSLQRIMGHRELATTQRYLALVDGDIITQHRRFSPLVGLLGGLQGQFEAPRHQSVGGAQRRGVG